MKKFYKYTELEKYLRILYPMYNENIELIVCCSILGSKINHR